VVVSAAALALLAPVFAAIAAAIRLEDGGRLVYAGVRVGKAGRLFRQLKFRTMRPEFCDGPSVQGLRAAEAFQELLDRNPALRDEFALTQKLADDPRVTRVGRFLRRTSLDELPQLWNVLKGDLSLVGPRPVTEREMHERYRPRILAPDADATFLIGYWDSPGLRPGLTGYWQISGRSTMSFDERVRLDTAYLTSWSLGLDLQILAKTVRVVVRARGAY
jgi:undecaprenyl-phosphate galactose phosphotransferase